MPSFKNFLRDSTNITEAADADTMYWRDDSTDSSAEMTATGLVAWLRTKFAAAPLDVGTATTGTHAVNRTAGDARYQPLDSDLTALAAADNSAVLAATTASFVTADETKLDALPTSASLTTSLDGKQPLDSDLTAIAALTTTATGRSLLAAANAAAIRAIAASAPTASPTLTGIPAAPTAATAINTTQLATTAYVKANRVQQAASDAGRFAAKALQTMFGNLSTSRWTVRTSAADNNWREVAWAPELGLFAAVSNSGTGNRVMTSPDGITWTIRTSAADNNWYSVAWAAELGLFAAVAYSGAGNRVMTSPDGITWTIRTSAADNQWLSVAWAAELGLFAAVSITGTGNRVMTSRGLAEA